MAPKKKMKNILDLGFPAGCWPFVMWKECKHHNGDWRSLCRFEVSEYTVWEKMKTMKYLQIAVIECVIEARRILSNLTMMKHAIIEKLFDGHTTFPWVSRLHKTIKEIPIYCGKLYILAKFRQNRSRFKRETCSRISLCVSFLSETSKIYAVHSDAVRLKCLATSFLST